jgi:HlyD family secretion protein
MKKRLKWIIPCAVAAAAAIALYSCAGGGVSAEVLKLSRGDMEQNIEETAQAVSRDRQTVYIEGTGMIACINVDIGDEVKQGDILLSLEKADLELRLKDAEAGVEAAKAQLKGTELINYVNGIELARVAAVQRENEYETAKRKFDNAKKLYESGGISAEGLKEVENSFKASKAALDSAKLQLAELENGAPGYIRDSYKAQLEQAVVYRDTIMRSLQKQEVKAPIDGVVIERLVEENSPAAPAVPAFIIGNPANLELVAEVLADDANKVKTGNRVEITGRAIGDAALTGKVKKIAPAARTVTSSLGINQKRVPVTIELTDKTDLIKPGYDLDIKIITAVIRVPFRWIINITAYCANIAIHNNHLLSGLFYISTHISFD